MSSEKRLFHPCSLNVIVMGLFDDLMISVTHTVISAYLKDEKIDDRDQIQISVGRT